LFLTFICPLNYEHEHIAPFDVSISGYSSRAPVFSERIRIWGRSFLGTEALSAFFPAFPCLYLGIEALFAYFFRPGHFSVGRKSGKSALTTDRVCMRTSLICPEILVLSKRQGRGTSR
jgi:hypothetical protein